MRDFPEIQSEKAARKKKNISLVEEAGFSAHAVILFRCRDRTSCPKWIFSIKIQKYSIDAT